MYTLGGTVDWHHWHFPNVLNTAFPHEPAILFVLTSPQVMKKPIYTKNVYKNVIAELFLIVKD